MPPAPAINLGNALRHSGHGPIREYACHEGNYAATDILGGARKMEAAETKKSSMHRTVIAAVP